MVQMYIVQTTCNPSVLMRGFIYILNNAAFPGLLKIGGTERSPIERARELSTTGIPSRFAVVHSEEVSDWAAVEKAVHDALKGRRYTADREFFEISVQEAIQVVGGIAKRWLPASMASVPGPGPEIDRGGWCIPR